VEANIINQTSPCLVPVSVGTEPAVAAHFNSVSTHETVSQIMTSNSINLTPKREVNILSQIMTSNSINLTPKREVNIRGQLIQINLPPADPSSNVATQNQIWLNVEPAIAVDDSENSTQPYDVETNYSADNDPFDCYVVAATAGQQNNNHLLNSLSPLGALLGGTYKN